MCLQLATAAPKELCITEQQGGTSSKTEHGSHVKKKELARLRNSATW